MNLSSKLLVWVCMPAAVLLVAMTAAFRMDVTDQALEQAREEMQRATNYASLIIERRLEAVDDGLASLLGSYSMERWRLATDDAARDSALRELQRESLQLLKRTPELQGLIFQTAGGEKLLTVGATGDLPAEVRQQAAMARPPESSQRNLDWSLDHWALLSRTGPGLQGSRAVVTTAMLDLDQVLVNALDFTSHSHPGACLTLTSTDQQRVVTPGSTCRHTEDRVGVQTAVAWPTGMLTLHASTDTLLTGVTTLATRVEQVVAPMLALLVITMWFGLSKTVMGPLRRILGMVNTFDQEQRLPPRVSKTRDELGVLETSLRNAIRGLLRNQERTAELNNTLESRVQERTQQLGHYSEELRAARDEARVASAARADFVTSMSHAVRTPLNGILGMTSLLRDTELSSEQREYTEAVTRSGNELQHLLDDVIHFSRLDRKQIDLEESDFEVRRTLRGIKQIMAGMATEKELLVDVETHPDLPQIVRADVGRIRQVLEHLGRNAVHFTGSGEVILRARPELTADGRHLIRFEVQDSGVGIGPEARKQLFQPFSVGAGAEGDGRGLGLALCSLLAQAMGGSIGVQSQAGRGSTFWFTARCSHVLLDEAEAHRPRVAHDAVPETSAVQPDQLERRILVVEDDLINQKVATRTLEKLGFQVDVAANGLEAVQAYERSTYGAILMDCQMPVMDGYEATAAIRLRSSPGGTATPIIAMTANAMDGDRERALAAGMDDYLSKPVSRDDLSRMLRKWIHESEAAAPLEAS
jgi:signal transduction histidine kinase/ActR/RegA family two-component response regulator